MQDKANRFRVSDISISIPGLFVLSVALLYLIYSPAVNIPFYHHDIYKFSMGGFHKLCREDVGYYFLVYISRPYSAYLDCLNFKLATSPDRMIGIRVLTIVMMGLTSILLISNIRKYIHSTFAAFCMSVSVLCLPALQTSVVMGATNIVFSIFMALSANLLFSAMFDVSSDRRKAFLFKTLYFVLALLFLRVSLLTYSSVSSIFFLPTLLTVIFADSNLWQKTRRKVVYDVIFFAACCGVYFVYARHLQQRYMGVELGAAPDAYKYNINFDILPRLQVLLNEATVLWNIYAGEIQRVVIYLILTLAFFLSIFQLVVKRIRNAGVDKSLLTFFQKSFFIAGLLFSCAIFFIVQPERVTFPRVLLPFHAAMMMMVVWALLVLANHSRHWHRFGSQPVYVLTLLFAAYFANNTVAATALNDNMEMNYVNAAIANKMLVNKDVVNRIHVISSPFSDQTSYMGYEPRGDIFHRNCGNIPADISPMVQTAFNAIFPEGEYKAKNCIVAGGPTQENMKWQKDCISKAKQGEIVVTFSNPGEEIYTTPNMLVINMKGLSLVR